MHARSNHFEIMQADVANVYCSVRPFFNYLVYGSADPIFEDLERKKKSNFFLYTFF